MSVEQGTEPRRLRASWFFSEPYIALANSATVQAHETENKGLGLVALRDIPRRNIICYYPAKCRRVEEDKDNAYALLIFTERGSAFRSRVCDIPLNSEAERLAPKWRNKPVFGHLINEADSHENVNAAIVFLVDANPRSGMLTYVPVIATRDVVAGEEIRLDYGPSYDRSHYPVLVAGAASLHQPVLA